MKQIKSKNRVQKYGEVFTAEREVKAMCDLIPVDVWDNIDSRFLEPACGNGNFLVEIYARKLERCNTQEEALRALNSIYAIDIQTDNCEESRQRLKQMYLAKFSYTQKVDETLDNNIICGNSLEIMKDWSDTE